MTFPEKLLWRFSVNLLWQVYCISFNVKRSLKIPKR